MPLALIGIGLFDQYDITVRGLDIIKRSDIVYLEHYTSTIQCTVEELESFYGKKIIIAGREMVEKQAESTILHEAKTKRVSFLIAGDPLSATTHIDLMQRARCLQIEVTIVPNASILTAVGITGLQLYKCGKTASIPFYASGVPVDTPLTILQENQKNHSHTLFLLDLDPSKERFMTIPEALSLLLQSAKRLNTSVFNPETLCIGCSRLGSPDPTIKTGTAKILEHLEFGKPPYCLIVPGQLHFMEEESINRFVASKS